MRRVGDVSVPRDPAAVSLDEPKPPQMGVPGIVELFAMQTTASISMTYGIDPELAREIVRVALSVGAQPWDLARLIAFESRFNPKARNPITRATGLIQFIPSRAAELGFTVDEIASMNAVQQMVLVEEYLKDRSREAGIPLDNLHKLSMSVFYPAYISSSPDRQFPPSVPAANNYEIRGVRYYIRTPADYVAMVLGRPAGPQGAPAPGKPKAPAEAIEAKPSAAGPILAMVGVGVAAWFIWRVTS